MGASRHEAQDRPKKHQQRAGCPGLGNIGAQVLDRKIHRLALQPGIQFGHLMMGKVSGGGDHVASNTAGFCGKAVSTEAKGDQTVIVRPYGAILIGEGVKCRMIGR